MVYGTKIKSNVATALLAISPIKMCSLIGGRVLNKSLEKTVVNIMTKKYFNARICDSICKLVPCIM